MLHQVTEAGKTELPSWMTFDPASGTLEGVPSEEHVGMQYFIEVVASKSSTSETEKDMFTVDVIPHKVHADTKAIPLRDAQNDTLKLIQCPVGSSITMATVIVDVDLPTMLSQDKVALLRGLSAHLSMPVEVLRLSPKGNLPMFDSSALVAGPGNVKSPQKVGAQVQWEVGCGNVYAPHMPILQQLESSSSNGEMGDVIGVGIVGWYVTNNKPHSLNRMKRRVHVRATPTPVVHGGPPTHRPMPTVIVDRSSKTDGAPTRVIPGIKPSRTRPPHRGRSKSYGRHAHKSPKYSPSGKDDQTDLVPQRPSQVITATPTVTGGATMRRIEPTFVEPSRGVSRTHGLLEPSLMPTQDPSATEPTQILPTHTYDRSTGVSTEPIRPTKTDKFTPPTKEPTKKPVYVPGAVTEKPFDYAPILKNGMERIKVRVGDILDYSIPPDTFYDFEDGDTRQLKLAFLTVDGMTLPRNSWLKFNRSTQRLYGLPLPIHVGKQEYVIVAIDNYGNIARDLFDVVVQRQAHQRKINHEFSVTLDLNYMKFVSDVDQRIDVASKIARMYGDNNLSKITVTKVAAGSVIYAWTNNSVPTEPCPVKEIAHLLRYLITTNNTLNESLINAMKPYRILKAGATPYGACAEEGGSPMISTVPEPPREVETIESKPRDTSDDDLLIIMIVPAVIIVVMLLLAALIACILYRRKRRGKLSDEDQDTFIKKGIPIIFTDELDDKPEPPTKPLIMDEEKPPMQPPPQYSPPGYRGSEASSPHSQHKEPFLDSADEDDPMMTYQRPPPVTANSTLEGRNSRPRAQPAYRSPPPYVPP